jgi:hypothetical protein
MYINKNGNVINTNNINNDGNIYNNKNNYKNENKMMNYNPYDPVWRNYNRHYKKYDYQYYDPREYYLKCQEDEEDKLAGIGGAIIYWDDAVDETKINDHVGDEH